jgi:hypothetical protein
MNLTARTGLLGATAVVGGAALALPWVHLHPTDLALLVALLAWGAVALVKSGHYADSHTSVVWNVAVLLHLACFLIPASAIFLGLRNRNRRLCLALLGGWGVAYLAFLYLLFPASAGP